MDDAERRATGVSSASASVATVVNRSAGVSSTLQSIVTNRNTSAPKVQQPKPQALPTRSGPSSIIVSPRQKGNPILNSVRSVAWEYGDIVPDYVLGATTCLLFLSLKYHRLHPEYVYNRIRDLKGQYQLRILLVMVDIDNHEESLKELSKTSLVNNVTIMIAWSAQEAGRYLELFKNFENAAPTSIKAQQSSTYSDSLVEFITVPRSINKTDAIGLVSNFGSIRTAINAGPEEIALIAGWGDKKVQRWANAVREPFRLRKAAKRTLTRENTRATMPRDTSIAEGDSAPRSTIQGRGDNVVPMAMDPSSPMPVGAVSDARRLAELQLPEHAGPSGQPLGDIQNSSAQILSSAAPPPAKRKHKDEDLSEGVMAALNKLRKQ